MPTTVDAIYDDGKLLLPQPLPLPNKSHVRITIETANTTRSETERAGWLKLSEEALMKAWDNPDDDVFNELLQK